MLTPVRSRARLAALLVGATLAAALVGAPAVAGTASAPPSVNDDPDVTPESRSGSIRVTITVRGLTAGGEVVTSRPAAVWVQPECYYMRGATGADHFEWFESGEADLLRQLNPSWPSELFERPADLELYKDDTEGHWYHPACDGYRWLDEYRTPSQEEYLRTHDSVYVEAGENPPQTVVIDPEVLAQIAFDEMDLPLGDVQWNPTRTGDAATFVNLETWVWLEDAPVEIEVTAEVPGTWATVTGTLERLEISAPGADTAVCPGAGVPWTAAQTGTPCTIVFTRSSANQDVKDGFDVPTTTTTVTAVWAASWTSSQDPTPTALPTQTQPTTAEIPVAEIQSIVSRD